jgi:hypothetical protein
VACGMGVQQGREPHHHGVCLNQPVDETPDLQATTLGDCPLSTLVPVDVYRGKALEMATENPLAKVQVAHSPKTSAATTIPPSRSKLHITPIESLQRLFRSSSTKGANKPFRISTLTPHKIAECRRITSSLSSSVDAASNDDVGICRAVLNLCAFA